MGKNYCIGLILLFANTLVNAQYKMEFAIECKAGVSSLIYSLPQGKCGVLPGGGGGVSTIFFITKNIGVRLGAGVRYSLAMADMGGYYWEKPTIDEAASELIFRYRLERYKETQSVLTAQIPLMFQFQSAGTVRGGGFYAVAGFSLDIPLFIKYSVGNTKVRITGYYPEHRVEIEQPAFMGIGTFTNSPYKGSYGKLNIDISTHLELGYKFVLSNRTFLYLGLYGEYGLLKKKITKFTTASGQTSFIIHNKNEYGEHISMEYSPVLLAFEPKINLFSGGIKVAIAFAGKKIFGAKKRKIKPVPCP
jgi:hypothetical protein